MNNNKVTSTAICLTVYLLHFMVLRPLRQPETESATLFKCQSNSSLEVIYVTYTDIFSWIQCTVTLFYTHYDSQSYTGYYHFLLQYSLASFTKMRPLCWAVPAYSPKTASVAPVHLLASNVRIFNIRISFTFCPFSSCFCMFMKQSHDLHLFTATRIFPLIVYAIATASKIRFAFSLNMSRVQSDFKSILVCVRGNSTVWLTIGCSLY